MRAGTRPMTSLKSLPSMEFSERSENTSISREDTAIGSKIDRTDGVNARLGYTSFFVLVWLCIFLTLEAADALVFSSGTLEELIARLADENLPDWSFVRDFLSTCYRLSRLCHYGGLPSLRSAKRVVSCS